MLRGEWERVGKEVGEGKERQMKGSRKGDRERVGGGGDREGEERRRRGEGRVRGRDEIGWRVGRKGN